MGNGVTGFVNSSKIILEQDKFTIETINDLVLLEEDSVFHLSLHPELA